MRFRIILTIAAVACGLAACGGNSHEAILEERLEEIAKQRQEEFGKRMQAIMTKVMQYPELQQAFTEAGQAMQK